MNKKIVLMGLVLLGLFFVTSSVKAFTLSDALGQIRGLKKEIVQLKLGLTASIYDAANVTVTTDLTPRISYWYGKVNQHVDVASGTWQTDPDGSSGGQLDKLTYCKKWYPNTIEIDEYKYETINTWKDAGNLGNYVGYMKKSYECIQEGAGATPSITVMSPNGGETYNAEQQITVKWDTANISANTTMFITLVKNDTLFMDVNNNSNSLNDGSEVVTLPRDTQAGSNYKISVETLDGKTMDYSNNSFTINSSSTPSSCVPGTTTGQVKVSLSAANPESETLLTGENDVNLLKIKLTNESNQDVCLNGIHLGSSYNLNNFIENTKIIDASTNQVVGSSTNYFEYNGSYYYSWVYPKTPISIKGGISKEFLVYADILDDATVGDFNIGIWGRNYVSPGASSYPQVVNGNIMTIKNTDVNDTVPSITVTSPNGGESYLEGQTIIAKWASYNISSSENVIIRLYKSGSHDNGGGQFTILSNGTINDGIETFKLSKAVTAGQYQLDARVDLKDGSNSLYDISDNTFTINSSSTPSITVLSPNGGEKIDLNSQFKIKWNTKGVDPNALLGISVDIYKNRNDAINNNESNSVGTTIISRVKAGDGEANVVLGSENLTFLSMINDGINLDNVKVKIFNWEPYHTISDTSDLPFNIISNQALIPSITVISPNGGETYKANDQINIKWKSKNIDSNRKVNIVLSAPDEIYDIPLISNTPNDGVQGVVITPEQLAKKPGVTSFKVLVISSGVSDYSDNSFTINSSTSDFPAGCLSASGFSSITGLSCGGSQNEGVKITVLKKGSGDVAKSGDTVYVNYTGKLIDGTVFDSNIDSKFQHVQPFIFLLGNGQVIKGWDIGILGMKVGEKRRLEILPSFAYGSMGMSNIPANSTLIFDVELIKINDKKDGCSNGEVYSSTTGKKCLENDGSKVKVTSPNGGENIIPGAKNIISWTGGLGKIYVGVAHPEFKLEYLDTDRGIFGWIEINGKPNSSVVWDGISLTDEDGEDTTFVGEGNYKILIVSENEDGDYCVETNEEVNCNYDLSDRSFTINASSDDDGCTPGDKFNLYTGQMCPTQVNDGCLAGYQYSPTTGERCSETDNEIIFTRSLKLGMRGTDVMKVQQFLGLLVDGSYGEVTERKVKEWQMANGLIVDGVFGRSSQRKMLELMQRM